MRILYVCQNIKDRISHEFKRPVKLVEHVWKGNENECACALNVQIWGRGIYLANPTLCCDSKFHHWNSSPQLNSTPPLLCPYPNTAAHRRAAGQLLPAQLYEMHIERKRWNWYRLCCILKWTDLQRKQTFNFHMISCCYREASSQSSPQ
jgi:hypothetical protein